MTCGTCAYFAQRDETTADGECVWGNGQVPFWLHESSGLIGDFAAYVDRSDGEGCAAWKAAGSGRKGPSKTKTYTRASA